jgi:hypothetical protein
MEILQIIGVLLLVVVGIALFVGACLVACRATAAMFPLDERYSDLVERSLPVRGRWLRMALRALIFPLNLVLCWYIAAIFFMIIAQCVMAVGMAISAPWR